MQFIDIFLAIVLELSRVINFILFTDILGFKLIYIVVGTIMTSLAFRFLKDMIFIGSSFAGESKSRPIRDKRRHESWEKRAAEARKTRRTYKS